MQAARAAGLVPPAFLVDKTLAQMTPSARPVFGARVPHNVRHLLATVLGVEGL